MKLSDKTYDVLKFVAQYALPALGTLYFALSNIWGLPSPEKIVGTVMALDVFLGVILNISNDTYKTDQKVTLRIQQYTQPTLLAIEETETPDTGSTTGGLSFLMSKELYNILYWIAMILLPATGALYFALAGLWGFPYGEQVLGTIAALDAFLGVMLGISTMQYKRAMEKKTNSENPLYGGE